MATAKLGGRLDSLTNGHYENETSLGNLQEGFFCFQLLTLLFYSFTSLTQIPASDPTIGIFGRPNNHGFDLSLSWQETLSTQFINSD